MNLSLLIPGLCSVLLFTAFAYLFASSLAPIILLATSTILLILSYTIHRNQYQSDYRNSTWQEGLRPIAPFVLVGTVLVVAFSYLAMTGTDIGMSPARGGVRVARR
jgi:heme/copper-type cytochrome/quinol oxidase subunit 4